MKPQWVINQLKSIWKHQQLFVDCAWFVEEHTGLTLPESEWLYHDHTKLSEEELFGYSIEYGGGPKGSKEYDKAWAHHWRNNPHHWQYWEGEVMPTRWVVAMVTDWMASSWGYTGGVDMCEWLNSNLPRDIHHLTHATLRHILGELGYTKVTQFNVSGVEFKSYWKLDLDLYNKRGNKVTL